MGLLRDAQLVVHRADAFRRPRHDRSRHRGHERSGQDRAAAPASDEAAAGEERRERHGRPHHRRGNNDPRRNRNEAGEGGDAAQARGPRPPFKGKDRNNDRGQDRNHDRGKGRFDKSGRKDDRGGAALRTFASTANPRERDRPADPNSPFAKLAALKDQLAGNRKD